MTALPIDLIVKTSLLLGAAALADAALARRGSAAARHVVWSLAIAALLILPLALYALPQWQVRIPVESVPGAARFAAGESAASIAAPQSALPDVTEATGTRSEPSASSAGVPQLNTFTALTIVYGLGVVLLLARLLVEPLALRRLTRDASVMVDPSWRALFEDAAGQMRVRRAVQLLRSERDVMPLTFGTRQPIVVLPASADGWSEDRRRAVLLHELAHVARRDCLVQRLTAVASAIYWPHPGVWWAAHRLRVERELACDDRVLAAGAPARDYAGHLLELAHTLGRAPAPATALGMARARHLERRLLAILDAARNRATLRRRGRAVALLSALALFVPIAALRAALVATDSFGEVTAPPVPVLAAQDSTSQDFTGTWDLRPSAEPGMVHVTVRTARGNHGRTVRQIDLEALTKTPITATTANVRFAITREAGTFNVEGVCRNRVCGGTFSFGPSATFAGELAKRGIGRPTPQEHFDLALADVGVAFLDTLAATGYAKPDLRLLVKAAQHGVNGPYVREMAELGYRLGTVDRLILLRDHGVDPTYVRGMAASGISGLSADDLVRTRDHGVDPEYIRGLAALGYSRLTVDTLVGARDHGVDPAYVRGMADLGYKSLTLETLIRTRDHGVDPAYVRGLSELGHTGLPIDALVNARDHGVDPTYIRGMADLGYKGVAMDALIKMRDHGVDPEFVRRLQRNGAKQLSVDELIYRRDRGDRR